MGCNGCGGPNVKIVEPVALKDDVKRVLVITNDSTVFRSDRFVSAWEMFGGRMTEVKTLVARLSQVCDISFAIISGMFGFIPANYVVRKYDFVPACKEDYQKLQEEKDFVGQVEYIAKAFDQVIVCVPKDMFEMMVPVLPKGKVIAVTNEKFRDDCEKNGWTFYLRNGARVGNENADAIVEQIDAFNKPN